jgi:hypothetical protein
MIYIKKQSGKRLGCLEQSVDCIVPNSMQIYSESNSGGWGFVCGKEKQEE